jgi:hypothetical protein
LYFVAFHFHCHFIYFCRQGDSERDPGVHFLLLDAQKTAALIEERDEHQQNGVMKGVEKITTAAALMREESTTSRGKLELALNYPDFEIKSVM